MKIISLGLGVQSTALYYMSSIGELPRVDFAIFIDPGKEQTATYDYLNFLLKWKKENDGIEIIIVKRKNLFKDLLNKTNSTKGKFSSIPAFTKNEDNSIGMLRRQCTNEYKIEQIDKIIREQFNLLPRQRIKEKVEIWFGISLDEISRMSKPKENWKICVYPFIGYYIAKDHNAKYDFNKRMTRNDIINWYNDKVLPIPIKSACIFCPFQSDKRWLIMKKYFPEDFKNAIKVDEAIRNSSKKGVKKPIYLHKSLIPLNQIDFKDNSSDLWNGNCSDMCHD